MSTKHFTQLQTKPTSIKTLILDFGGVIYEISHEKQMETFAGLGIHNFDELYSQAQQSPLFADLECGRVSAPRFKHELGRMIGNEISSEAIDRAWNSILVGFPDENVRLVKKLGKRYNLFLLSNTNAIHYDLYSREFIEKYGFDFNALFRKTFWSFKEGMRKPDHEIYHHVMSQPGVDKARSLFIDDTRVNITSAREAGMPAYWLEPGRKLVDLFDENLNLIAKV